MSGFEEPTTLATFDRSYGDKHEQLRFEQGEFNGRATFAIRTYWQTPDGQWRWCAAKPSQSGKCWQSMSIKARELRELGQALIAAADEQGELAGPRDGGSQGALPRERRTWKAPVPARSGDLAAQRLGSAPAADDDSIPF